MPEVNANKTTVLLLTTDNAAELFDVKPLTIYRWRSKRNFPYCEFPNTGRAAIGYDLLELAEWAEERKVPMNQKVFKTLKHKMQQ